MSLSGGAASPTLRLYGWARTQLPALNGDVLAGRSSVGDLIAAVNAALPTPESPTRCDLAEARRQLVILGLVGSSVERHSQEAGGRPGDALAALRLGTWSFRKYFATLACRGGGPPRDSFQSFVIWNGSDVDVYLPGDTEPYVRVPSAFPDASGPLTFSDDPGERLFIDLLKRCAAMEEAANTLLWPVCDGSLLVDDFEALERVGGATLLLQGLRAEMNGFRQREVFTVSFFLDILRQYACAWEVDEVSCPPSGAHDLEYIVRDVLLGTPIDRIDEHVDGLFHVLDAPAQARLQRARAAGPLVALLGRRLGMDLPNVLPTMTTAQLFAVAAAHPWLACYTSLFRANGAVSASHWAMVHRYLVAPMRARDRDAIVVSNYEGTGHLRIDEIRQFMTDRCKHVLFPLQTVLPGASREQLG